MKKFNLSTWGAISSIVVLIITIIIIFVYKDTKQFISTRDIKSDGDVTFQNIHNENVSFEDNKSIISFIQGP
jgi:hypothetical protein